MDKNEIYINNYIFKIVGVFEGKLDTKLKNKLGSEGYRFIQNNLTNDNEENDLEKYKSIMKNLWYPEFRNLFFITDQEKSAKIAFSKKGHTLCFEKNKIEFKIAGSELYFFPNQLNLFKIDIKLSNPTICSLSDLTVLIRDFFSTLTNNVKWVDWIEQNILCGINISSKRGLPLVNVDDYSGNKFKLFMVLDIENQNYNRDELLYELGCIAPIGSNKGIDGLAPAKEYFDELMVNKISVFKNWSALPLLDTFTAIGNGILINESKFKTWNESYFKIYLYNLFLKYSLFKYNAEINDDTVKLRDKFIDFINGFYFSHISYNFLPNIILNKSRLGLEIDQELRQLHERVNKISQKINEEKQSRTNLLITIITILTSLSSVIPISNKVEGFRIWIGINVYLFYALFLIIALLIGSIILAYIYPKKFKKILNKWIPKKK
jgi:hypothetical protein